MKSNNPKISIVVPIYNVERYLPACLDTILEQPFSDFELILVNDGSTDNCLDICNEYSLKDDRINVVNKKNGGLSSARNAGIEVSTGKYIVFIDPDDQICENYLESLYNIVEKKNVMLS
ncbi:glycosyltransferase [Bacillus sp. 1P10SD]|uniref:glycosyltransferase family 2 protein n=1 Tax=Bacillus sp. 1P10SD TaxID=3132265 RepID=UPI0039A65F3F